MYKPQSIYVDLAFKAIQLCVLNKSTDVLQENPIPKELQAQLGCFVSIHTLDDDKLRGCIGTLQATRANLQDEIIRNAIAASTQDSRFEPIEANELNNLKVSVDVLSKPQPINSIDELNPKEKGIIVSFGKYNKGVLLPNLEGINTAEQQLQIAKQKAGLKYYDISQLTIHTFTSKRFY